MCSVRGIGVAESASTSTSSRSARRSSFCATPKRCSSSTITRPRSFGITSRERRRCVPTRTSTLPAGKSASTCFDLLRRPEARDHLDAHREVAEALAEGVPVLLGEDRRRHEHQHLLPVHRDRERRAQRHLGLAEADVAADEPVHRAAAPRGPPSRPRSRAAGRRSRGTGRRPRAARATRSRGRRRRRAPAGAARRGRAARRRARAPRRARGLRRCCQALPPSFESAGAFASAPM